MASSAHRGRNRPGVHYGRILGASASLIIRWTGKTCGAMRGILVEMLRGKKSVGYAAVSALVTLVVAASATPNLSRQLPQISPTVSSTQSGPVRLTPNFAHDVAPIIYRNCVSCHRPGGIDSILIAELCRSEKARAANCVCNGKSRDAAVAARGGIRRFHGRTPIDVRRNCADRELGETRRAGRACVRNSTGAEIYGRLAARSAGFSGGSSSCLHDSRARPGRFL